MLAITVGGARSADKALQGTDWNAVPADFAYGAAAELTARTSRAFLRGGTSLADHRAAPSVTREDLLAVYGRTQFLCGLQRPTPSRRTERRRADNANSRPCSPSAPLD